MRLWPVCVAAGVLALALGVRGVLAASEPLGPVNIPIDGKPLKFISEYRLFKDPARQIPNDGVLPYDLNSPLFSDYAAKHRFVWMPPGTSAAYDEHEAFTFPIGTVLIKTFAYPHDMRDPAKGERILETRLLIHQQSGWVALPYIWNDDVTEARLAVAGGKTAVSWIHTDGAPRGIDYFIPNMNQCKQCHENDAKIGPIGPKARHLNKDYAFDSGVENQLSRWAGAGYLKGAPEDPHAAPRTAVFDDKDSGSLDERARAWLDINCAHCHNPKGPAFMSGLDLSYFQTDPAKYGVMKAPVAAGRGSGGFRFGIEPGAPDHSILMHRITSDDPGVMMPTLGRVLAHDEGVALIREWIQAMPAPAG